MRGFSSRLRFLAAFGWCRNDMGEQPPVDIRYLFRTMSNQQATLRRSVHRIERLGYKVTLQAA